MTCTRVALTPPPCCPRCGERAFTVTAQVFASVVLLGAPDADAHVLTPTFDSSDAAEFHASTSCVACGLTWSPDSGLVDAKSESGDVHVEGLDEDAAVRVFEAVSKAGLDRIAAE